MIQQPRCCCCCCCCFYLWFSSRERFVHPSILISNSVFQVLPYRCRFCQRCFQSKSALDEHTNTHRIGASYRYHCVYCNKRFNSTGNLYGHLSVHTGKKAYSCSLCHKDFAYKSNLKTHLRHTHNIVWCSPVNSSPLWRSMGGQKFVHRQLLVCSFICLSIVRLLFVRSCSCHHTSSKSTVRQNTHACTDAYTRTQSLTRASACVKWHCIDRSLDKY